MIYPSILGSDIFYTALISNILLFLKLCLVGRQPGLRYQPILLAYFEESIA